MPAEENQAANLLRIGCADLIEAAGLLRQTTCKPDTCMQTISLSQEELATRDGSGKKVLVDGRRGAQRYEYATFQAYDDASLKLSIYTPV